MAIVTTDNAHYAAIAAAIRKRAGGTATYKPSEMADAIKALPASGDQWTRPASWPNYDLIDRTDMEAVFFTYDCRAGIETPEITDWMCVRATTSSGQWRLDRGYIDADGYHAVWGVNADSGAQIQDTLPVDEGDYVVYRMTPASADGHLTRVTMMPPPGGTNNMVYTQRCVERWGRLPYVTQFGGTPAYERWSNHHVEAEDIADCTSLTTLVNCFNGCYSLQKLSLGGWDTSNVDGLVNCFSECRSLKTLDLSGCDFSKANTMTNCFSGCCSLQSLNLGGCGLSGLINMLNCFYGCRDLQILDLSGCSVDSTANMSGCFSGCYNLQILHPCAISASFDLSQCAMLTHQSLVDLFGALPTVDTAQTVTLGAANINKLSPEEIAVATGKGWTVA